MSKDKIWALFSVDNMYDQSDHNLVAWQFEKPTIETIAKWLGVSVPSQKDEETLAIVNIWSGKQANIGYGISFTTYSLKHISEGLVV